MILAVISYHHLHHHHYFFIALYGFKLAKLPESTYECLNGFQHTRHLFLLGHVSTQPAQKAAKRGGDPGKECIFVLTSPKSHNAHSMFQCASWTVLCLTCSCRAQCWREPPPLKGGEWMWRIRGSWGRNNTGTSPLWVSGSLDRLVNIAA